MSSNLAVDLRKSEIFIHPTAVVDPAAKIGERVSIGPYSVIGPHVELGDDIEIKSHVVIEGHTKIGARTRIFSFAAVGYESQDKKYKGETTYLEIGTDNVIREHATLHPGTEGGGSVTRIGNHCLFMVSSHVAHDCQIGNNVIMANNATLAGHVTVGDFAIIGGLSAVHQFVRIGEHAMIGGMSGVDHDVIPFGTVKGERGHLHGLNLVGLKRRGFKRDTIKTLRNAYRLLFAQEGSLTERMSDVASLFEANEAVMEIVTFMRADDSRSICQPKGLEFEEDDII